MEDLIVLVVDDESLIVLMIEDMLHEGGFKTKVASSGEKAIKLIDENEGKFSALITDVNLGPGNLRGWDVAHRAREVTPTIPVVYVTGDSEKEWASQGVPNSILIHKPFATAQILTAVANLLNHAPPQGSSS